MEMELQALLSTNKVPANFIQWLDAQGCFTVKNFVGWADSKAEVVEKILKPSGLYSEKDSQVVAALKWSWREADAMMEKQLKRAADGLSDVPVDEPLSTTQQDALVEQFFKKYSWELSTYLFPSAQLLGRIRREFEAGQPAFFP